MAGGWWISNQSWCDHFDSTHQLAKRIRVGVAIVSFLFLAGVAKKTPTGLGGVLVCTFRCSAVAPWRHVFGCQIIDIHIVGSYRLILGSRRGCVLSLVCFGGCIFGWRSSTNLQTPKAAWHEILRWDCKDSIGFHCKKPIVKPKIEHDCASASQLL